MGFRVQGMGFRVQCMGFRVQGMGFGVHPDHSPASGRNHPGYPGKKARAKSVGLTPPGRRKSCRSARTLPPLPGFSPGIHPGLPGLTRRPRVFSEKYAFFPPG